MIEVFRKKPTKVLAIQYTGLNREEIIKWTELDLRTELESETAYLAGQGAPIFSLVIPTNEGDMKVMPGDWVIEEPFPTQDRQFYPCKKEIFEKTYEKI
jgi:hypothetical protein